MTIPVQSVGKILALDKITVTNASKTLVDMGVAAIDPNVTSITIYPFSATDQAVFWAKGTAVAATSPELPDTGITFEVMGPGDAVLFECIVAGDTEVATVIQHG